MLETSIYRERWRLYRQIRFLALMVLLLSLLVILLSAVVIRQAVAATLCSGAPIGEGFWSWRLIDGRKCWFRGHRTRPKDSFYWSDPPPKSAPAINQIDVEKAAPGAAKAEIYFPALQAGNALDAYPPLVWHQPWYSSASMMHWPLLMDIDRTPFVAWDRRVGQ